MTTLSWVPGGGWAVVTSDFAVWLAGEADSELARDLFALAGPEAFSEAGDLLAVRSSSYALLQLGQPRTIQRRGGAAAAAWGQDGSLLSDDVTAAVGVRIGPTADGPAFPISHGVVACGAVIWGAPQARVPQPPAPEPAVAQQPAPEAVAAQQPSGFIDSVPDWVAQAAPNPFAALWGETMRRPVEAAAVRFVRNSDADPDVEAAPPARPVDPPPDQPDRPVGTSQPPAKPVPSSTATLIGSVLDLEEPADESDHGEVIGPDGRHLPIVNTVVIGRAPRPLAGAECQLLRVASPERGISRSHVALSVIDGLVRARDLGSNNGTTLVRAGARRLLDTESWTALRSGDVLDLGESVTVLLAGLP